PDKGEYLLFNTRTQAMVKVNQELKEVIDNYYAPQNFILKTKYYNELIELRKMGITVESEHEDREKLKSFFHQLKYSIKKSCLQVTILTTDACNFDCVYCFEKDARENINMEASTCNHAMDWMKNEIERLGYEELYITFYGGEPLVNKPILEYLASEMKNWCGEKKMRFRFMLQTNGYLMTLEYIEKLLKLGLSSVLISVDGLAHVHDKNRPLKGGGGTFQKIMDNIIECIDKVKISLSVSYDKDDIKHIEDLLDYLDNLEILHKFGNFIFSPIHPSFGPRNHPELFRQMSCMLNYDDDVIVSANEKIRELMERKKLPTRSIMAVAACPLTRENAGVTIDPCGRIYKCNSMLGYPEFAVGDVRDNSYNEKHDEFLNLDAWKKCPQDCTYLPMCSGGCRFMAFLENKNFTMPTCKKNYLDKVAPEFIKKEYETLAGNVK
ncbi:MAG: radical SAM protein, partial [Candidatus Heimdallarchaeota archaeon]|nr:radical SAM protein [Candidatus Heimdallarchaeota archaeon]